MDTRWLADVRWLDDEPPRYAYGDVVEATWYDHAFHFGPYRETNDVLVITSVGYVVRDDDDAFVLAQSATGTDLTECLHIHPALLVSVVSLKEEDDGEG